MSQQSIPVIISSTGVGHGWGTEPHKWVSHLTIEERAHVREGTATVLIDDCPLSGGNHGTTLRRVEYRNGRYVHRVPADTELQAATREGGSR